MGAPWHGAAVSLQAKCFAIINRRILQVDADAELEAADAEVSRQPALVVGIATGMHMSVPIVSVIVISLTYSKSEKSITHY